MMQKDAPNWNIVITKKREKNSDCKENLTIWGTMLTQGVKLIFFLVATWLLNFSKW